MKIMLQQSKDNRGIGAVEVADLDWRNRRSSPALRLLPNLSLVREREADNHLMPWQRLVQTPRVTEK